MHDFCFCDISDLVQTGDKVYTVKHM